MISESLQNIWGFKWYPSSTKYIFWVNDMRDPMSELQFNEVYFLNFVLGSETKKSWNDS